MAGPQSLLKNRGRVDSTPLEMWECRPGKPPGKTWIKPDPITGNYKLHVKSIPNTWTDKMLWNAMRKVGRPAIVYLHPSENHPLTWGFVEFATFQEANAAVQFLNNDYFLDNIQIAFARDKNDPGDFLDDDEEFEFCKSQSESRYSSRSDLKIKEKEVIPDLKMMKKTIHNEQAHRFTYQLEDYLDVLPSLDMIKGIEKYVTHKLLQMRGNSLPASKCCVCQKDNTFICSECRGVSYCSEDCQVKDWPTHSRNCEPLPDKNGSTSKNALLEGDNARNQLCNGDKLHQLENGSSSVRANQLNDNRYREKSQSAVMSNNRHNDKSSGHFSRRVDDNQDQRSARTPSDSRNNKGKFYQNDSEDRRGMFDQRNSRFSTSRQNQEPEKGMHQSRQFAQGNNNSDLKSGHRTQEKSENFTPFAQISQAANTFEGTPKVTGPVKVISQAANPFAGTPQVTGPVKVTLNHIRDEEGDGLSRGKIEKVVVLTTEESRFFNVILSKKTEDFSILQSTLNLPNATYPPFTPEKNGICAAKYEDTWCRCQVIDLNPLTVLYLDYGNSETLTADKLFTIPGGMASKPPYAIKIKLAEGTPASFLDKNEGDEFSVMPIQKVDGYWVVQVSEVGEEDRGLFHNVKQEPTLETPPYLPLDVFTEVRVICRNETDIAVIPLRRIQEHEDLKAKVQSEAANAPPIQPQMDVECLIKYSKTNQWYRGCVVETDPLFVYLVDYGNTVHCLPGDLRSLPCSLSIKLLNKYATRVKTMEGISDKVFKNEHFSIKPVMRDGKIWIVELATLATVVVPPSNLAAQLPPSRPSLAKHPAKLCLAAKTTEPSSNNSLTQPTFPHLFKPDQFTRVTITFFERVESGPVDTCYVGHETQIWEQSIDMSAHLAKIVKDCDLLTPEPGAVGLAMYEGCWYRVKVVSLSPLLVHYMDFGNTEPATPEDLKQCPESHKHKECLVYKIKLASGTDPKYCDLTSESHISVKPLSVLPDGTIVVQVEGKTCSDETPVSITVKEEASSSTSVNQDDLKETSVPLDTVSKTVVAAHQSSDSDLSTKQEISPVQPPSVPSQANISAPLIESRMPQTHPFKSPKVSMSSHPAKLSHPAKSAEPVSIQPTFPDLFRPDQFTTVSITHSEASETGSMDTYYVGCNLVIWQTLTEMSSEFSKIVERCDVLTLQIGAVGITLYESCWYRVKVVSLSPLLVYYMDFGNTEPATPEDLKQCPETHKDIGCLVHKVKLAAGTNSKYFDLPSGSDICIKPVSTLPDGTIVVQVEGETYSIETPILITTKEESPSDNPAISIKIKEESLLDNPPISIKVKEESILDNPPISIKVKEESPLDNPSNEITSSKSLSSEEEKMNKTPITDSMTAAPEEKPQCSLEFVKENWTVSFVPTRIDTEKYALVGVLYSKDIPKTDLIMTGDDFDTLMELEPYDSDYKANEGELVGYKLKQDWTRALVLPEGMLALIDFGDVVRSSTFKKIPQEFISVPFMATVLTLPNQDLQLLDKLNEETEISFFVDKVMNVNEKKVVRVKGQVQTDLLGEFQNWKYEPLSTPYPLITGDMVTIRKVIDSNTLLVTLYDDVQLQQTIQIESRKSPGEEFQKPPEVGDHVIFFVEESDGFCRSRIVKINPDKIECELFHIDLGIHVVTNLLSIRPLPSTLSKLPCRITQVGLKDVEKVDITEAAQIYIRNIVLEEKPVKIEFTENLNSVTLILNDGSVIFNKQLQELLKPQILPDLNGKLTIKSLLEARPPMNEEVNVIVVQTEPLYLQINAVVMKYYEELYSLIQDYCESQSNLYNPCQNELCFAKHDGDWYRALCLRETNLGTSDIMLVDFGNMFTVSTQDIRQIQPEFLVMPCFGLPCKILGLPSEISPDLKKQLDSLLAVYKQYDVVIESESEGYFQVKIPSLISALQTAK